MGRERRKSPVDAEGFKLGKFKANTLAEMSEDMRTVYETRDNVRSEADLAKLGDRPCRNCAPDEWSMPHREKHCPLAWGSGEGGSRTLPANAVARRQKRVLDNMERLKHGQHATMNVLSAQEALEELACDIQEPSIIAALSALVSNA